MLPAWVMGFPDGSESGAFLALDMGGTNLRVCEVVLLKDERKFDMIQSKYRMVTLVFFLSDWVARVLENRDGRAAIRLYSQLSRQVLERQ